METCLSRPQSGPKQGVPQAFLEVFPVSAALCLLWAVSRQLSEFHQRCAWEQSCCIPRGSCQAAPQCNTPSHLPRTHAQDGEL